MCQIRGVVFKPNNNPNLNTNPNYNTNANLFPNPNPKIIKLVTEAHLQTSTKKASYCK